MLERDPPRASELLEPRTPRAGLGFRDVAHPQERLVHLVRVPRIGPGLLLHARDRFRVEGADRVRRSRVERAPALHRLRAPLLDRSVVEEAVGAHGQDRPRERRGLRDVDRDPLDRPVAEAAEEIREPVDVHRLVEAVVDRLPHDRVVGDRDVARGSVSPHAAAAGKHAASRSSARIRRICGATTLPPWKRSSMSARDAFHLQRAANIGVTSAAWTSSGSTVSARR
jgi:hypothetical protein